MSAVESAWAQHTLLASRRREFLGAPIHALTMAETLAIIEEAIRLRRPLHHVVVNVATIVSMRQSTELYEDIAAADMVNVDGKGVLWGARLCGVALPERVANYDIMINLFGLSAERGYKPFLLGAEQYVLDAVAARLAKDYPNLVVAGRRNGYFKPEDEAEIVAAINASDADCLFVAMPTPYKERFLKRYRHELKPSFVTGVGGGFDVYGGKVARAPVLVQEAGLEWVFRLVQEPRRLWRRYYDTNTVYAGLLFRELRDRRARQKVKL
ncbi:glycosyltransferase [Mesorhizobium loti]|nr:WecB/TagA/CpsF family glycosyltransferase [Mesorhizobium loti]PLP55792.1 glycosyltransferase [Mesorhizobium loti]